MALPSSGVISMSDVNVELGLSSSATISLNDAAVRSLFGIASGTISLSDGYGKSNIPGPFYTVGYHNSTTNSIYTFKNPYQTTGSTPVLNISAFLTNSSLQPTTQFTGVQSIVNRTQFQPINYGTSVEPRGAALYSAAGQSSSRFVLNTFTSYSSPYASFMMQSFRYQLGSTSTEGHYYYVLGSTNSNSESYYSTFNEVVATGNGSRVVMFGGRQSATGDIRAVLVSLFADGSASYAQSISGITGFSSITSIPGSDDFLLSFTYQSVHYLFRVSSTSGSIVWSVTSSVSLDGFIVSSNGTSVYAKCYYPFIIAKINLSNGSLLWAKEFSDSGSGGDWAGLGVDNSNNPYYTRYVHNNGTGGSQVFVLSDSDGSLLAHKGFFYSGGASARLNMINKCYFDSVGRTFFFAYIYDAGGFTNGGIVGIKMPKLLGRSGLTSFPYRQTADSSWSTRTVNITSPVISVNPLNYNLSLSSTSTNPLSTYYNYAASSGKYYNLNSGNIQVVSVYSLNSQSITL
jgi:hypothetical protein